MPAGAATFCCSWMQVSAALPRMRASDPPGAYFSHAGKVGKRALRGVTPKDPKFLEQGRGGVYFRNDVGSGITYGPRHSPVVRLSACETVTH